MNVTRYEVPTEMPPVTSPLGLCSFCHGRLTRCAVQESEESVPRSKEDFLLAQHTCYFCAWLGYIIRLRTSQDLPENLEISMYFYSYFIKQSRPCGQYQDYILIVAINGLDCSWEDPPDAVRFFVTNDADSTYRSTGSFPPVEPSFRGSPLGSLAANWIKDCQKNHTACARMKNEFRPKRMIEIIDENHSKLVSPRDLPLEVRIDYIALSHCWGGSTQILKLTNNNEHQLQGLMRVDSLPKTFREAISACLELEICYLWVDSLCIIQDNSADWHEQAAEMGLIHENSALNLCMAGSANSSQASFGSRNTNLMLPLPVTLPGLDGKETTLHLACDGMFEGDINRSPLRERGWVFQEWYLATRSLIFGRMQLWWHCRAELACETFPDGIHTTSSGLDSKKQAETMKDQGLEIMENPYATYRLWLSLTEQYAMTKLTQETQDRVIAFSGISKSFGRSHNIAGGYVAGLWESYLPRALVWYASPVPKARSLESYKAPSWSWMSINGPMDLRSGYTYEKGLQEVGDCCSVEQYRLFLVDKRNKTGALKGGYIQIHGHLLRVSIEGSTYDLEQRLTSIHFGQHCDDYSHCKEFTVMDWDERDSNNRGYVSYPERNIVELDNEGHSTEFSRTITPLEHVDGSVFALPISHTIVGSPPNEHMVSGIILYQPPRQPGIFHRIASYDSHGKLDLPSFKKRLQFCCSPRSIRIF